MMLRFHRSIQRLSVRSLRLHLLKLCVLVVSMAAFGADAPPFDPQPWLADLQQIQEALAEKYANLEWQVLERETDLAGLFAQTERAVRDAHSEEGAKAAIRDLIRQLHDGHVEVWWPDRQEASRQAAQPQSPADTCRSLGYDASRSGHALATRLPGYQPLDDAVAPELPAGLVWVAGQRIGVVRIGLFSPDGFPQLCESMLQQLSITPGTRCDSKCADRIEDAAYLRMSSELAARVHELRKRGATVLLVDLTGNGGGSEWAEAAARMLSPIRLRSERLAFVRGEHWVDHWRSLAQQLRHAAQDAPEDREQLLRWAAQVDQAQQVAATPCLSAPFWSGQRPACRWLGQAFYATGLLAEGDAAVLRRKSWGPLVFSPAEFAFEERVWNGPLLVLMDGGTGSAAAQFAAVLQDNKAAVLLGSPAAGGCGHTNGGTPTALTHTGGTFSVPDCVRIRLDGSNEMMGIDPDILIGFRPTDGLHREALRVAAVLTQGVAAALRLCQRQHCSQEKPPAVR
jgi:hypothetical protein